MSDIEPKKAIETTPKKQSCLEWSFKRGNDDRDEESEQWAPCTPSPFKKVRAFSSEGQWKAFTEDLEATRLRRIAEVKDRGY